jgi:diguanylate cyclase (GGDEF)-like protein
MSTSTAHLGRVVRFPSVEPLVGQNEECPVARRRDRRMARWFDGDALGSGGRALIRSSATLAIGLIGALALVTGPDLEMSFLYVMPIAAAAWYAGRRDALIFSIAAASTWLFVERMGKSGVGLPVLMADEMLHLAMFAFFAWLIARVRIDRDELRFLNACLEVAVDHESELARTDALTGLPNRRRFIEQLDLELARPSRDRIDVAFIDLDNFKAVNDRYGHADGDRLLQRLAAAIREVVRPDDFVARLAGDEFAVLFVATDSQRLRSIAERFVRAISLVAPDYPLTAIGATIGIGSADSEKAIGGEELLARADRAMYAGKAAGKGRISFLDEIVGDEAHGK